MEEGDEEEERERSGGHEVCLLHQGLVRAYRLLENAPEVQTWGPCMQRSPSGMQ